MTILQKISLIILLQLVWGCTNRNQAEIDAAAQKLFEQNIKELKMAADEACLDKRATYVTLYKDSLSQTNKLVGDE